MRVMVISKALVVGAYHKKNEELASLGVDLHVVLPHRFGNQIPEKQRGDGYAIHVAQCALHGKNHFHFYPELGRILDGVRPDILHIDEESYSAVTYQAMTMAVRRSLPALFFNWQNILKEFPFPFSSFERYAFRHARAAIAGNNDARDVLIRKGCSIPVHVIPQFGVDPSVFAPRNEAATRNRILGKDAWVIGYGGRLVEEKGLSVLLHAVAGLPERCFLLLIGDGPYRREIERQAASLHILERIRILDRVPSSEMPRYLNCLDCLVLPSLTGRTWKEQFGRILVEAMACGVPVVGSDSGEIPNVIGSSGVIVPEGNVGELRTTLLELLDNPKRTKTLASLGRKRVLEHFTQKMIAQKTYDVYRSIHQDP